MNPYVPGHVFAAGQIRLGGSALAMGIFKSTDAGAHWSQHQIVPVPDSQAFGVAFTPSNENVLYVGGTINGVGVLFVTRDGGASWSQLGASAFSAASSLNAVAVDPARPERLWAGAPEGLWRSDDGGVTWTKRGTFDADFVKVDPAASLNLYAAGEDGVFASADGGATWTAVNEGLEILDVRALDWLPAVNLVFAGTSAGGVFRSGGANTCYLTLSATSGGTTAPAPGTIGYSKGTSVTVTALPEPHFRFSGWSGAMTGTANPISLVMDADKSIAAAFAPDIDAPLSLTGARKANRSVLMIEYFDILNWQPNPANEGIAGYRVYVQEGVTLVKLADLGAETREYRRRNVGKDKAFVYAVTAVDSAGLEGDPAWVTVQ